MNKDKMIFVAKDQKIVYDLFVTICNEGDKRVVFLFIASPGR